MSKPLSSSTPRRTRRARAPDDSEVDDLEDLDATVILRAASPTRPRPAEQNPSVASGQTPPPTDAPSLSASQQPSQSHSGREPPPTPTSALLRDLQQQVAPRSRVMPDDDVEHHENAANAANVLATSACRLPPFWRSQPELWFLQVESVMQVTQARSDATKYHLAVGALDPETLMEVSDIIRNPPEVNKYATLKARILERLTDSADRQLDKMLNELTLDGRKPSQLFRHMRSLAGNKATDDVLRIRWLSLLPLHVQSVLKIFKTNTLDEMTAAADQLMESPISTPGSYSVSLNSSPEPPVAAVNTSQRSSDAAEVKLMLAQLLTVSGEILARISDNNDQQRFRSSRPRSRTPSPRRPVAGLCWYHTQYGEEARRCLQPCTFRGQPPNPGTQSQPGKRGNA